MLLSALCQFNLCSHSLVIFLQLIYFNSFQYFSNINKKVRLDLEQGCIYFISMFRTMTTLLKSPEELHVRHNVRKPVWATDGKNGTLIIFVQNNANFLLHSPFFIQLFLFVFFLFLLLHLPYSFFLFLKFI